MTNTISFPGLNLGPWEIDRVAFNFFGKDIYWYGVIIAIGFMLGIFVALNVAKKVNITSDNVFDLVLYCTPVAVICARVYYVVFNLKEYDSFMDMIAIWEGGIAIYGAIIGAVGTAFIYSRIKKINTGDLFDAGLMGVITGQIVGRWGNFVNAEAYGYNTDSLFRMMIEGVGEVHPTFLYESMWNLVSLIILFFVIKKRRFSGQAAYTYAILYGIGRFMIESLRTDSLYLGDFRVSQLVAILSIVIGVTGLCVNFISLRKNTTNCQKTVENIPEK